MEEKEQAKPVNLLREKTFNDELRGLLDKINKNEDLNCVENKNSVIADNLEVQELNQILQDYHQLFYKAVAFQQTNESYSEDILNSVYNNNFNLMLENVKNILIRNGFESFTLFWYNADCYSFLPIINTNTNVHKEKMVISCAENLYLKLCEQNEILTIDRGNYRLLQLDNRVDYLKKSDHLIAAFSFAHLLKENITTFYPEALITAVPLAFAPLILVDLEDAKRIPELMALLKEKIHIPIINYFCKRWHKKNKNYIPQFSDNIEMLNQLLTFYGYKKDNFLLTIMFENILDKQNYYLLQALLNKINLSTNSETICFQIEYNKSIIFTSSENMREIETKILEYNLLYGDLFKLKGFTSISKYDLPQILEFGK